MAAMGRVQDEAPAKSAKAAAKGVSGVRKAGGLVGQFFANLARNDQFKPTQGRNARLWTAVGLGVLVAAGVYSVPRDAAQGPVFPLAELGIPVALALGFAWAIWRLVQFPPFADFLIATEAEMKKVSWTSREDLRRATIVVLSTVFFLALYLFGVDYLWSALLQAFGVLKFNSEGFGAQAG